MPEATPTNLRAMSDRLTAPRQTFSQQVVWALTRRGATAAPLSSSATASLPSQQPVDHRNLQDAVSSTSVTTPLHHGSMPTNPFEDALLARPPSPINLNHPETDPSAVTSEPFSSHVVELLKPLPLSQPRRDDVVADRARRLRLLTQATVGTTAGAPPPPQGPVLRLVIALLARDGGDDVSEFLPDAMREAALDLLTEAVKLSDKRSGEAPKALIETRSGAPGSQSSKSLDSDQPLATIDRALLYRLVVEDKHRSPEAYWGPAVRPKILLSPANLAATALPCLPAKLRALETLSKGGREVVAFDNIVKLLSTWLSVVWHEVQALRQLSKLVDQQGEQGSSSSQTIERHVYVEHLSRREWSLSAIFHLLTSILMFSFAKVDQRQVSEAMRVAAHLFVDTLEPVVLSKTSLNDKTTIRPRSATMSAASKPALFSPRSRSHDRRKRQPSLEGSSYYGMESLTPDSGTSTANSPSMTPRLELHERIMPPSAAPITLATLPPSATSLNSAVERKQSLSRSLPPSRLASFVTSRKDEDLPAFPELQNVEVRCVFKLLDAALKFGYIPLGAIKATCEMLCRILGFEPVLAKALSPNGPSAFANTPAIASLTPWQELALPVLANLLKSHCANSCLQVVRSMLIRPDTADTDHSTHLNDRVEVTNEGDKPIEDEATIVGAVIFLRFALLIISKEALVSGAGNMGTISGVSSSANSSKENALAPRMSLSLILPALRGGLARQSDLVDLQIVSLVEALLVPTAASPGEKPSSLAPGGALSLDDWDELLQLTTVAQRHVDLWRRAVAGTSLSNPEARIPAVLNALVGLLSRIPLAPADQVGALSASSAQSYSSIQQSLLPWSPRLCSLLLATGPALPSSLIDSLIDYHRAHHLCLPCASDWITNIHRLMQAFLYGPYCTDGLAELASKTSNSWQNRSHKAITAFLFEQVYDSVVSFGMHRTLFLREVLIPVARSTLFNDAVVESSDKIRHVLVQAAALSSVSDDTNNGEEEKIFDIVRQLLSQLTREADRYPQSVNHAHVHFAEHTQEYRAPGESQHARQHSRSISNATSNAAIAHPRISEVPSRGTDFALDLIEIFNVIAFASPWLDFGNAAVRNRDDQERQARNACLVIFSDLMELLSPAPPGEDSGAEKPSQSQSSPETPSTRTRIAILQWFLHIRTDRHHHVYLTGNLDESVSNYAATLLKTAESRAAAAQAEGQVASSDKHRAARNDGRESRRTASGNALDPARSKSRARESSTERGRAADKVSEKPRRATDRSASCGGSQAQAHRKAASEHQTLWQIPETLAFKMPTTSLRSDIVYTYIHSDDPTCSQDHIYGPSGQKPAPLPVSALLATYIRLIETEKDWELVSYLICFLPHQLANRHLFCGPKAQKQVLVLRSNLCAAIEHQKLMPEVVLPDDVKRSDVYAVIYVTLTTLLSYRALFNRNQQEEMVNAFIAGLNKSQNTALPCVRALSVAVYEAQKSVTRLLPKILVKLSTIMSSMTMSVHILELIGFIGQIPACYANLTEADYRRVFGIALQYIQCHQSPAGSGREDIWSSASSFALSQYVMMLAYYNISLWFMTLRLSDRAKHVPSIARGLLLANEGRDVLSDNSEVCFDFLSRFTHSNVDPKPTRSFMNSVVMGSNSTTLAGRVGMKDGGNRASKTWLIGKGLITISTLKKEGWVEIVIRRSSGTTALLCKVENASIRTLPEEDGERIDLPAALMMGRNPNTMSKPVLKAPNIFLRAAPFELTRAAKDRVDNGNEDDAVDDVDMGITYARRSLQQEAKETLRVGERTRGRRLRGPSHFGLGNRPRSASFSGAIEGAPAVFTGPDPYRLADAGADDLFSVSNANFVAREDAIAKVMQDILDEGSKIEQGRRQAAGEDGGATENAGSGSGTFALAPPVRQSADRDFAIDPSTIALQLSSYPDFLSGTPILLPDEPATTRLIKAIDLTPVVDLHKIGLLYVAPGQKTEPEILGNRHGSPAYARFLAGLGDLITLRRQEDLYTGGLDREQDFHGKYAYAWSDDISQIVFHAATMMPNRVEADPNHSHKKALIGNDWVHIVFNESGGEYAFGTLPSQFNYVNIVISPNTKGGTALGSIGPMDTSFYRVSLQRRPGLPSFSPLGEDGQLISAACLSTFVRSLALNANVMSQIYNDTSESMQPYSSNWCNRLNHIARFKRMWQERQLKKKRGEELSGPGAADSFVMAGSSEHDPRDFTNFA